MKSAITEKTLFLWQVADKYSQTCRWTFLKGVLAIRSMFPASLAACRVREGCFLRNIPRHSCGGTEMQRVLPAALDIAARLGGPGICTKRKGLSDRWHSSQQAEPALSPAAVCGAHSLQRPDNEMLSCVWQSSKKVRLWYKMSELQKYLGR